MPLICLKDILNILVVVDKAKCFLTETSTLCDM